MEGSGGGSGGMKCGSAPGTGNGAEYVPQLTAPTGNILFSHGRMEGSGWEGVGCRQCGSAPGTGGGAEYIPQITTTTGNIPFSHGRMEGSGVGDEEWVCPWTGYGAVHVSEQVLYHLVMKG